MAFALTNGADGKATPLIMPPKKKVNHSLSEERANITSKTTKALKKKTGPCNEKEVNGFIVELQSFQGVVEFKIQNIKEIASFFKNRVFINGKKLNSHTNLLDVMEVGAKVRLKVKPLNKRDSNHKFKILEVIQKNEHSCTSTGPSFTQSKTCATSHATDNLVSTRCDAAPWNTTVSKLPYIDGAAGTVVNIFSDSTGIVLTDPDDNGGCKVSFEISNLFINGEICKEKSLSICIHLGQSVYCTATKANEKDDIEYKAFAVWIGQRPSISTIISCYVPKIKLNNLTQANKICCGTVKLLAPPKAAILTIEPNNYAVMFITHLHNIKPDAYGWIGDYVQVGDKLLVQISGYFDNLCFAVSKVLKVNKWCKEVSEMLDQTAKESSGSTRSSCISLNKSSQIACITNQDTVARREVGWMQNKSHGSPESFKNNKSPGNKETKHLFAKGESQKINKTVLWSRTGKIVSYSSKSRGLLSDIQLGYVKFHKAVVLFPAALGYLDLQEYLPVGTTVHYDSLFLEKKQKYICTKLWIGKKEKQPDFQSTPLMLQHLSTELTEGDSYEGVVFELQRPHGLIALVKTPDMEVPVYVSLHILQLYPDGPFIDEKQSSCIKCGDVLFVRVHYSYNTEKTQNWVASKAWIRTSCADFGKGKDAIIVKNKIEPRSPLSGRLVVITSDSGVLSREIGRTVFFRNKNAFLFEINLSQMDLQKVFIEGETLHYILPEDSKETIWHEASKVWYGTVDNKETLEQRIDALRDYWKKRDLQRPTLRTLIKELTKHFAVQNQVLSKKTEMNSVCNGDISCVSSEREKPALNKETISDVDLKMQQAKQNLQIASKGTVSNNFCSDNSNLTNVYSDKDVSALIKDTNSGREFSFESKMNTKLHIDATQSLTVGESTVTLVTGFRKQQNMISTDILANRELSTLAFESKHVSSLYRMKQEVLRGLLRFITDGSLNPTILREVQVLLKPILQKYDDTEAKALKHILKQMQISFGKGPRQTGLVEDERSSIVNLTEKEECFEASGMNKYKLNKERCVAVDHGNYKDFSVQSGGTKCVDTVYSHVGTANCLLNKESSNVTKIFCGELQSNSEHMNHKITKEKKYANKEVQTISTGEILYFRIVPDM